MQNRRRSRRKSRKRRSIAGGRTRVNRSKWRLFVRRSRRKPRANQQQPHRNPLQQCRRPKLLPRRKASALPPPRNPPCQYRRRSRRNPAKARARHPIDEGPRLNLALLPSPVKQQQQRTKQPRRRRLLLSSVVLPVRLRRRSAEARSSQGRRASGRRNLRKPSPKMCSRRLKEKHSQDRQHGKRLRKPNILGVDKSRANPTRRNARAAGPERTSPVCPNVRAAASGRLNRSVRMFLNESSGRSGLSSQICLNRRNARCRNGRPCVVRTGKRDRSVQSGRKCRSLSVRHNLACKVVDPAKARHLKEKRSGRRKALAKSNRGGRQRT